MADYMDLRHNGAYEDKTAEIAALMKNSSANGWILAKPNGFGKSTLLSTVRYLCAGNRENFRHLAVDTDACDLTEHPVVFLNMARLVADSADEFRRALHNVIIDGLGTTVLGQLGKAEADAETLFDKGLTRLCETRRDVVVLIDNADAPIRYVQSLSAPTYSLIPDLNRFYSLLRRHAAALGFLLVTSDLPFEELKAAGANELAFLKETGNTLSAFRGQDK